MVGKYRELADHKLFGASTLRKEKVVSICLAYYTLANISGSSDNTQVLLNGFTLMVLKFRTF